MKSAVCGLLGGLLVFASPSFARELPPLSAYGDLPGVEGVAIAPGGTRIAAISRIKQERHLFLTEGNKVISATPISDLKIRGLQWAGDDMLVVHRSETFNMPFGFTTKKNELSGAIIIKVNGEKPESVFMNTQSIGNAIFGTYGIRQVEGRWAGYFAGIKYVQSADRSWVFDHGRPALFAVDLEKNRADQVAGSANEGHWRDWLVNGEGKVAALLDMRENGGWEITSAAGTKLAQGVAPYGDVSLISFGRSPQSALYSFDDQDAGMTRFFEVPLSGGQPKELLADVDIERLFISDRDGTLLGYLSDEGPSPKPVLFDPRHQASLTKIYRAFPNVALSVIDWTPDLGKVIVRTRGNGDSGTYYAVDLQSGRANPIGYERPSIFPEHVGPISTVAYKAGDGLDLDGILTLPPGREPKDLPVIMLPHGGPYSHDDETFDWWAQAFASRGYAVFQPNFRGSTNRDNAFRDAGNGQWGRKMQTDVSDGLAELVKRGIADPGRACIMGASYGGYAALAGVTLQKGIYRCAVAVAPVSDLKDMYWTEYRESGGSKMVRRNFQLSLGDPSKFEEISPRRHAADAGAPILLIHGKDDTVVAYTQSTRMADALKDAGKPYEFVTLREEDHWLSKSETRKQMLEEAMRFVQKYNPADK